MTVRPLSTVLAEKARIELNEDPDLIEEKLRHFKHWVINQKHLNARTDDQWLIAFLRGCKYRMEQAKSKFDLHYSLRSTAPYLYPVKFNDPKLMEYLDLGSVIILPKTMNAADPKVVIYRLGKYDPKEKSLLELLSVLSFMEQICFMEDDNFVVAGTVHILDFAGTKFSHYTQTSLTELRSVAQSRQVALPLRIKKIHCLNTPSFFGPFFKIAKIVLSEKNRQRILFHNKDINALHEHVAKEILPPEYGGSGNSIQECIGDRLTLSHQCNMADTSAIWVYHHDVITTGQYTGISFGHSQRSSFDYWKNKIREYHPFFEEDRRYGSDETKRPRTNQSHGSD